MLGESTNTIKRT